jgi:hypothetical protein
LACCATQRLPFQNLPSVAGLLQIMQAHMVAFAFGTDYWPATGVTMVDAVLEGRQLAVSWYSAGNALHCTHSVTACVCPVPRGCTSL